MENNLNQIAKSFNLSKVCFISKDDFIETLQNFPKDKVLIFYLNFFLKEN